MSAPDGKIRAGFATKLAAFIPLPPVAWENVAFTPVIGTAYIQPSLLPAEPTQSEIGTAGINRHTGIYQISVFVPAAKGLSAGETLRDGLINHFKRGTSFIYSDILVKVQKAFTGPMVNETDWLHIPISIRYTADAAN